MTRRIQASDLPLEIINEIINQTDDRRTLCNWALTCKLLSVTAQRKLWSNLVISIPYEHLTEFRTFQTLSDLSVPRDKRKCLWVKRLELTHAKSAKMQSQEAERTAESQQPPKWPRPRTVVIYKKGYMKRRHETDQNELKFEDTIRNENVVPDPLSGKSINTNEGDGKLRPRSGNRLEVIETMEQKQQPLESRFEDSHEIEHIYDAPLKWHNRPAEHRITSQLKQIIPRLQNLKEIVISGDISENIWRYLMAIRPGRTRGLQGGVKSIILGNAGWPINCGYSWGYGRPPLAFTGYPVHLEELEASRLSRSEAEKLGRAIALGGSHDGDYSENKKKKKKHNTAWKQLKHLRIQELDGLWFFLGLVGQGDNIRKGLPAGLQTFAFSVRRYYYHPNLGYQFPRDHLLLAFDQCASSLTALTLGLPVTPAPDTETAASFERFYQIAYFPNLSRFSSPATNGDNFRHDRNLTVDKFEPFLEKHGTTLKVLHIHRMAWTGVTTRGAWYGDNDSDYNPHASDPLLFDFYRFLAKVMVVLEEFSYGCIDGNVLERFSKGVSKRYFGRDGALAAFLNTRNTEMRKMNAMGSANLPKSTYSTIERLRVSIPWKEIELPPHPWNEDADADKKRLSYKTMSEFLELFVETEKNTSSGSGLKVLLLFPSYNATAMKKLQEGFSRYYGHSRLGNSIPRDYASLQVKKFNYVHGAASTEIKSRADYRTSDPGIFASLAKNGNDVQKNVGWHGIAWIVARMLHRLKVLGIGETRFWIQRKQCPNPGNGIHEVIKVWNLSDAVRDPQFEDDLDISADEWGFLGRDRERVEAESEVCCDRMAMMVYDFCVETYRRTKIY